MTDTVTLHIPDRDGLSSSASVGLLYPDLRVEKTVDYDGDGTYSPRESADVGSVAHWRVVVYNDGDGAALNILLSDSNGYVFGDLSLRPGTSRIYEYDTVPMENTENIVTASLRGYGTVEDRAMAMPLFPAIGVVKTVDFDGDGIFSAYEESLAGSTAHWRIVVSNTGEGLAQAVALIDSNGHDFGGLFDLPAGGSRTFEYDTQPPIGLTVNTASALWTGGVADSTASVRAIPLPGIAVEKTVDGDGDGTYGKSETAVEGDPVSWRIVISNGGEGPAHGVTATDSNGFDFGEPFDLEPGGSRTFTYAGTAVLGLTVNTVEVTTAETGRELFVSSADLLVVTPPLLTIDKVVDYDGDGTYSKAEAGTEGDLALWRIAVGNAGGSTAEGVVLTDSNGWTAPPFDVAAGDSVTFGYATTPGEDTVNVATALLPSRQQSVQSSAAVTVGPLVEPVLAWTIDKTVDFDGDGIFSKTEQGLAGTVATWHVVVTNTGTVPIPDVSVIDSLRGVLASGETLLPGGSLTFDYDTVVTVPTANTATVSSEAMNGPLSSTADADPFAPFTPSYLSIVKTVDFDGDGDYHKEETGDAGTAARWKIVVANTGTTAVNGIEIADAGSLLAPAFSLEPGQSRTLYLVTYPTKTTVNTAYAESLATDRISSSARAVVEPFLPFTEEEGEEPFLPFTGGDPLPLLAAAALAGMAGLGLRRRGADRR